MTLQTDLKEQLQYCLGDIELDLKVFRNGKVRNVYDLGDKLLIVTSDRVSAFDKVISTIPFKGQILTDIARHFFGKIPSDIPNHLISIPHPNCLLVKKAKPLTVEFIIRRYITGSLWRSYEKGEPDHYGINLPEGLKKDQRFDELIFTPTTKADMGEHDMPLSEADILETGRLSAEVLEKAKDYAFRVFEAGEKFADEQGLILVDSKFEFGLDENGELMLIDEILTPDSSRYWMKEGYEELFAAGKSQKMLDKENLRKWLLDNGFSEPPDSLPDDQRVSLSEKYMELYKIVLGKDFDLKIGAVDLASVLSSIK